MGIGDIEVFIDTGVGESKHWAATLSRGEQKVLDKALPNDKDRLREVYQHLQAKEQVLVMVNQPTTIGTLATAMVQDMGITVGYLPGLSIRRIVNLTPGSTKTDAKDAAVIAQVARAMPHTLRAISTSDEGATTLSMLTNFDLDLARQVNQTASRIRGLYIQIHPALEQVLRPWLEHDAVLEVIATQLTPADLKRAGRAGIDARLKRHGCRWHATWAGQIVSALERQTVMVAGIDAAAVMLPCLARQLIALHARRADIAVQVETLMQAHPLYQVLTSMPEVGVKTAAVSLTETLGRAFNTGAQLASYAGLAPVTRHSDSSIHGEHVFHDGSKRLKRAMFLSAFASLRPDSVSRTYYQRKRDQGGRHNQAILALVHRHILTLHAMIHNGTLYDPQSTTKLPAAT